MRKVANSLVIIFVFVLIVDNGRAQSSFDGINYQIRLRDTSGLLPSITFPFSARITISNNLSQPVFQEVHIVNAWNNGLVNLVTGQGTPTGLALHSALRTISFSDSLKIKLELDMYGTGYTTVEENFIRPVPLAVYSLKNLENYNSNEMLDADTGFMVTNILKYVDGKWTAASDMKSDSVLYSFNAVMAATADTALYVLTASQMNTDTVLFSNDADSTNFALSTVGSNNADSAYYSAIAQTADTVLYAWYLKGNQVLSNLKMGTLDSTDLVIKTNASRRIRITGNGKFYLGIDTSNASFYQNTTRGFLFTKSTPATAWTFTSSPVSSALFFRADSAAFRGGSVSGSQWNNTNVSNNSFAFGPNNISSGFRSSIVFGDSCTIAKVPSVTPAFTNGWGSIAIGRKCEASGAYSVAFGYESKAHMIRNVAIGYKCIAGGSSANHAIGYRAKATGSTAGSFGYGTVASGHKSLVFGNYASSNGFYGGFVYGDWSTTDSVKSFANNQFLVRAAGGFMFYSDPNLVTGAELIAGSGSWSTVSDSLKKENFRLTKGFLPDDISGLKVYDWNYEAQSVIIRHAGPTAQSFYRYFKLGESETKISMVDMDGIILHYLKLELSKCTSMQEKFDLINNKITGVIQETDYTDLNKHADALLQKLKNN